MNTSCVFPHPSPYDWEIRVYNSANPAQELACNPATNRWEVGTPLTPAVTLEATGRAWRVEGSSCIAPLLAGTDTNVSVFSLSQPEAQMTCYSSYPYANTWRVVPPLTGKCYVGMPQANIPYECTIGQGVAASSTDGTIIGRYVGVEPAKPWLNIQGGGHFIVQLSNHPHRLNAWEASSLCWHGLGGGWRIASLSHLELISYRVWVGEISGISIGRYWSENIANNDNTQRWSAEIATGNFNPNVQHESNLHFAVCVRGF